MKSKSPTITTPTGIAVFPRLDKPDTKFNERGVYSVDIRVSEEVGISFREKLEALRDDLHKGNKKKKRADLPVVEEIDRDTGDPTGEYLIRCKSYASWTDKAGNRKVLPAPKKFDSAGGVITKEIWGGSELRASCSVYAYDSPLVGLGIKLQLNAVQVKKLVAAGQGNAEDFGFGEIEGGYVADPEPEEATAEATEASEFDDNSGDDQGDY